MKAKFYFILLAGLLLTVNSSFSQEKRFLEIISSDTIFLKPVNFTYQISLGQQMEFMGMKIPQDKAEKVSPPSISELEDVLKKEHFIYTISYENDYTISNSENLPTIFVQVKNEPDLKRLYQALKTKKGITGKIKEISYEPISKHYEELFKKLYSNAISQATLMAKITNNSIGQLLNISEIKAENDSYMDMYKQLIKSTPVGIFGESGILSKNIERKFTFKFELK